MQPDHDAGDTSEEPDLELTYTGVFVHSKAHIIVPAVVDAYAQDRRDHALVQHWMGDDWVQHLVDESLCGVVALGSKPTNVLNVGVGGHVVVARIPGGEAEEDVDTSARGPSYSKVLRCVKLVEGVPHVAGMARQVYRRGAGGAWSAMDSGVHQRRVPRQKATGFLDLDGSGLADIYAVGYKGEIWSFDGDSWTQHASPTNVALTQVLAASSGDVVAAGLAGTVIRGRGDRWRPVAEGQVEEDFWGLAEFRGRIYLASKRGLYRLDGDALTQVELGLGDEVTTSALHAADGILMSVGEKDIVRTHDGVRWEAMPRP